MGCGNSRTKHEDTETKKINKNTNETTSNKNVVQKKNTIETTNQKQTIQNEIISEEKKEIDKKTEESKNVKPKMKHGFTLTVKNSEPQNLDPNSVFYVENTSPQRNVIKNNGDNTNKPKVLRIGTFDKELEEKIKKRVDFDELVEDLIK